MFSIILYVKLRYVYVIISFVWKVITYNWYNGHYVVLERQHKIR